MRRAKQPAARQETLMAVSKLKTEHAILLVILIYCSSYTSTVEILRKMMCPVPSLPSHHYAHTAPKPQNSLWMGSWKLAELGWSRKTVPCILGHRHGESQNHHDGERPPRSPTYGHHGNVPQFTSPVPVTPPPPGQPGCQCPTTLSEKKLFHPT